MKLRSYWLDTSTPFASGAQGPPQGDAGVDKVESLIAEEGIDCHVDWPAIPGHRECWRVSGWRNGANGAEATMRAAAANSPRPS